MSAAAAAPAADAAPKKGSKKLLIIIVAVVLLLVIGGGAAFFLLKKKPAEEGGDDAEADAGHAKPAAHAAHEAKKPERKPGHPPTYVPLDPFVVNLADREQERYAQIGITLEVDDPKFAEEMKGYMPAIRNGVLMILSHKTSAELLEREGKEKLAEEVMREAVRPMGIEIDAEDDSPAAAGKKKRKKAPVYNPVQHVHFSSFIIQ